MSERNIWVILFNNSFRLKIDKKQTALKHQTPDICRHLANSTETGRVHL